MPFIRLKCECGKAYRLKPKMSGRVIACKECYATINVPEVTFGEEELAADEKPYAPPKKEEPPQPLDSLTGEPLSVRKRRDMPVPLFLLIGFATLLNGCSALDYSGDMLVVLVTGIEIDSAEFNMELEQLIEEMELPPEEEQEMLAVGKAAIVEVQFYYRWACLPMLTRMGLTFGFGAMLAWKRFGWKWVLWLTPATMIIGWWFGLQPIPRVLFDAAIAGGVWFLMTNLSPFTWPHFKPKPRPVRE